MGSGKSKIKQETLKATNKLKETKFKELDIATFINENIKLTVTDEKTLTKKILISNAQRRNQLNDEASKDMSRFIDWDELKSVLKDSSSDLNRNIAPEYLSELRRNLQVLKERNS